VLRTASETLCIGSPRVAQVRVVANGYAEDSATFACLYASENEICSQTDQKVSCAVEDQGDVRCFVEKGATVFCARFDLSNYLLGSTRESGSAGTFDQHGCYKSTAA